MTTYFLDSSALFKRYVRETGSAWIDALTAPETGNSLFIAQIARVEVISALARRRREGSLPTSEVNRILLIFRTDLINEYEIIQPSEMLLELASLLLLVHPLRAYDAVQLASAIIAQFSLGATSSLIFLSADDRLIEIARAESLLTDNPNLHP